MINLDDGIFIGQLQPLFWGSKTMQPAQHFKCLLTTIESDSHTWNLVYLQRFIQEHGGLAKILGCCVSPRETVDAIKSFRPDLVVVSSVNGHGFHQGRELITKAVQSLGTYRPIFVVGGKLTTAEEDNKWISDDLQKAGYDKVFVGQSAIEDFTSFLQEFRQQAMVSC
ncbi:MULTISPECIES: cobalamin B12-binding domain-containing protein [unclassified Methylobacter]|uniref:cobalamin B12-binding domain-containing protein n=1 Tax=unclassified Methylobacter TaxID=2635283 RepID=UPI001893230F|nr:MULTISPECIES: cobalamin B12-binding domain-containing protein [unclassified Methylobacter]MBF6651102.1 cobalamin B12-binding domain-containing protein [Methylobacter sp. BlB1]WAK04444.1 cobalamin B12-binding domain-containing protein [Methylobacter sp. YRD-M1]